MSSAPPRAPDPLLARDPRLQQQQQRPAPEAKKADPWQGVPPTEYRDGPLALLLISVFTRKLAAAAGAPATLPPRTQVTYDDFVRVARDDIMGGGGGAGRGPRLGAEQQRALVRSVLLSLVPPGLPALCRAVFRPAQWTAELNARIAASTFSWLVGEMELREAEVVVERRPKARSGGATASAAAAAVNAGGLITQPLAAAVVGAYQQAGQDDDTDEYDEVTRLQRSVVHIKRCRFLEASGCAGACVHMCKLPTQDFLTRDFGLALTMTPNFDDLSCDMVFGQAPLPPERDPALAQPCFALRCPTAAPAPACPQLQAAAAAGAAGAGGLVVGGVGGGAAAAAASTVVERAGSAR